MNKPKALVLCGGEGKRLRPLSYYIQKTMIPIGYQQRPLLEYIIQLLKFHGIHDVALLVSYKAEQIKSFFENGARYGIKIRYIHDVRTLMGTGGSVINAFRQGVFDENDTLLIYYGDIVTSYNLQEIIEFHKSKEAIATVALSSGFSVRVGLADIEEDGRIRGFIEKPELEKPVSIGLVVISGKALSLSEKLVKQKDSIDLMGDILPYLIQKGKRVYGFVSDNFWYDVGSLEALEKLDNEKLKKETAFLF